MEERTTEKSAEGEEGSEYVGIDRKKIDDIVDQNIRRGIRLLGPAFVDDVY